MIKALISFLFFLFGEAFFACSEIAFLSAERIFIESLASKNIGAKIYLKFWENPERLFTTTLMGITLCVAGNGIFTSYFLINSLGTKGLLVVSTLLPLSMLLFGQIIPKTFGRKFSYPLVLYLMPILYLISFAFYPIIVLNAKLANKIMKSKEESPFFLTKFREVLLTFIKYEEEIDFKERELMHKIVEFAKKRVSQVMVPLTQVKGLPITATVKDAIEFSRKYNFSYIPLYEDSISNIKAVVKVQHLIGKTLFEQDKPLKDFSLKPFFVPEVALAHEVLSQLQKSGIEFAVVVDEYGFTTGIITIEDLVEEVLGEFRDALDYYVPEYQKISENLYKCKGFIEIEKLQALGIPIPSGEYETLNGFIYFITGRIPKQGEIITYKNLEIEILKATPRKVEEVKIKIIK
ncbi:CBS domain containing protein [Thermodesulfobacterium geofontis OPF15]|jgi:CBS domain containing-hemolysin-like protein|uniref:CBS domain containing protein n=1 Tax=Thermodesulfobacterium geofontis (strain OPF15) TaxID=795359 RepID=F8C4T9_THEGP|nr:hemolysin family protein [Thermodesulfobacterium geofontis]AEH23432.1 CBS domain containing protein [Thermodesulfobacterium geofontis OPF15]